METNTPGIDQPNARELGSPKLHWWQFSLRSLFVFITLLAIGLGSMVSSAERQRRAVRAIWDAGGSVEYEAASEHQGFIHAPVWLQTIVGEDYFNAVIHANLDYTHISDAGLEPLKGLVSLESLSLAGTKIGDAGLKHLKGLTSLKLLGLQDTNISNAGLEHLKGLASLQELYLHNTQIGDAGLEQLQGLAALQELRVWNTNTSDPGLAKLKTKLPNCYIYK